MVNTPRAHALAKELRVARKALGLTLEQLAAEVGLSRAKVSRIENAKQGITEADVATLLAGLRIKGDEREQLLKMARELDQPAWWELHKGLAAQITGLIDAEQRAARITEVTSSYVPGLLQTRDYSRAIFESGYKTGPEIDEAVNIRQVRQGVLYKTSPADLVVFMDEAVLHRPVGGPAVAAEQFSHVLKAAERPNIVVRVVPMRLGAHKGLDGGFMLLETERGGTAIYVEAQNAGLVLTDPEEESPFRRTIARIEEVALPPDESAKLIAACAARFEGRET
ncbi:helix-turn-helix domain-containing protein [Saccharopolyspora erythraea]|uniref:helix-turn-helix domain-containing protein n=1 Tax=Saccharopolyspora erythraea TaxID=1836 RepID=UPI001BAA63EF|nr:helix-turn-helix transcriptional regulator [Saccharopolyspora erythraea]QUG99988.1 helix-turn-helix domain-containing protein [Saccharopolyspora erythraea]